MGRFLDRLLGRTPQRVQGVQGAQVVQVGQPAPEPSTARRVCRWCGRARPILEVNAVGLCACCAKVQDNLDKSLARTQARSLR